MKNKFSDNLPKINIPITPESPEEKRKRLEKQAEHFKILESFGIDTRPIFDGPPEPFFNSEKEQCNYAEDCIWATLFVNADQELPEDLKERLLEVKKRREEWYKTHNDLQP